MILIKLGVLGILTDTKYIWKVWFKVPMTFFKHKKYFFFQDFYQKYLIFAIIRVCTCLHGQHRYFLPYHVIFILILNNLGHGTWAVSPIPKPQILTFLDDLFFSKELYKLWHENKCIQVTIEIFYFLSNFNDLGIKITRRNFVIKINCSKPSF